MEDQKELREGYIELQTLEKQMQELQGHIQKLDDQMNEVLITKQAIDDYEKVEEGKEMLVPVANGIFTKASAKKSELIINVGNNVLTEKSFDDVRGLMIKQEQELRNYRDELLTNLEKVAARIQIVEKELHKKTGN